MPKPLKENSLTKKILTYLGETSKELLNLGVKIIFDPHSLMKGMGFYTDYTRPYFHKKISYLKKSKYFTFRNNRFYLTPWGRVEIIKMVIRKRRNGKFKWDGKWRGVIFDIPELNKKDRDFLRKELRWMGFKELQKSVWVVPYDIEKELRTLLKLWKMDFKGDIRFLIIDKIEKDKDLREYFNLK